MAASEEARFARDIVYASAPLDAIARNDCVNIDPDGRHFRSPCESAVAVVRLNIFARHKSTASVGLPSARSSPMFLPSVFAGGIAVEGVID